MSEVKKEPNFFVKYKFYFFYLFFSIIFLFISLSKAEISLGVLTIATIVYFSLSFNEKIRDDKQKKKLEDEIAKIKFNSKETKEIVQIVEKRVTNIDYSEKELKNKEKNLKILREFIDYSNIKDNDLISSLESSNIYILYCSANQPEFRAKYDLDYKREYIHSFLLKKGFVRLGINKTIFIISENKLPEGLRDIYSLKTYLTEKFKEYLKQDWDRWLLELEKKNIEAYKNLKDKDYSEVLGLNFVLVGTFINEENIGLTFKNLQRFTGYSFEDDEIRRIVNEEVSLDKTSTLSKKILKQTSIEVLLKGSKDKGTVKKIVKNENEIRKKLKILENILDLRDKEKEELIKVIMSIIKDKNKAENAIKIMKKNANKYHKAFIELGIKIL